MARRTSPPFRADHVGSLLRPPALHQARAWHAAGAITADQLRQAEDDAIAEAVRMQEETGLQSATGLVTTKTPALESADDLKRRVEQAARYVDADRLCLSPQCGFASTVEGNALTLDQQRAKLDLVVETAADLWG